MADVFQSLLTFWIPWEFSFFTVVFYSLAAGLYWRGIRHSRESGRQISLWRQFGFYTGILLCYFVMHTEYDYYAQYMFFMHRIQHLVLHHLGPFLIALSLPFGVLWSGIPGRIRQFLVPYGNASFIRGSYRVLQYPPVAIVLFVGLIFFWLTPEIHFVAMLNQNLYQLMNWSMLLDGLLFWWLIFSPYHPGGVGHIHYGWRILVLVLIMIPQNLLGAYITFSESMLFDVYDVCGRAWPLAPMTDQIVGGIMTWIPPAMMSVVGILILLGRIRSQAVERNDPPGVDGQLVAPGRA